MKKNSLILAFALLQHLFFCQKNQTTDTLVKNINGYKAVAIGTQTWMAENYSPAKFANGSAIPQALNDFEWEQAGIAKKPVWCYFDYNAKNAGKGKFYNYFAVADSRGLAPKGWHVPDSSEWLQLINYLGPDSAGIKLKSTSGWNPDLTKNCNGTNSSGFNGKAFGFIGNTGQCYGTGNAACFWEKGLDYQGNAWYFELWYPSNKLTRMGNVARKNGWSKRDGANIRCIKD